MTPSGSEAGVQPEECLGCVYDLVETVAARYDPCSNSSNPEWRLPDTPTQWTDDDWREHLGQLRQDREVLMCHWLVKELHDKYKKEEEKKECALWCEQIIRWLDKVHCELERHGVLVPILELIGRQGGLILRIDATVLRLCDRHSCSVPVTLFDPALRKDAKSDGQSAQVDESSNAVSEDLRALESWSRAQADAFDWVVSKSGLPTHKLACGLLLQLASPGGVVRLWHGLHSSDEVTWASLWTRVFGEPLRFKNGSPALRAILFTAEIHSALTGQPRRFLVEQIVDGSSYGGCCVAVTHASRRFVPAWERASLQHAVKESVVITGAPGIEVRELAPMSLEMVEAKRLLAGHLVSARIFFAPHPDRARRYQAPPRWRPQWLVEMLIALRAHLVAAALRLAVLMRTGRAPPPGSGPLAPELVRVGSVDMILEHCHPPVPWWVLLAYLCAYVIVLLSLVAPLCGWLTHEPVYDGFMLLEGNLLGRYPADRPVPIVADRENQIVLCFKPCGYDDTSLEVSVPVEAREVLGISESGPFSVPKSGRVVLHIMAKNELDPETNLKLGLTLVRRWRTWKERDKLELTIAPRED